MIRFISDRLKGSLMTNICEIDAYLNSRAPEELAAAISEFRSDGRAGVRKLLDKHERRLQAFRKELERLDGMMVYERKYAEFELIAGIDEAGRGPLAGPVVAAAVILPKDRPILYVNDSKQLSEKKREELFPVIMTEAVAVGVGMAGPELIDEINILQATYEAMRHAVADLIRPNGSAVIPDLLLNDAVRIPGLPMRQVPIIKGDAKSCSIAAASIIAKVTRDRIMREYDSIYPEYGFAKHKGYGSKEHIEALRSYGPCPIHRRSFIAGILGEESI